MLSEGDEEFRSRITVEARRPHICDDPDDFVTGGALHDSNGDSLSDGVFIREELVRQRLVDHRHQQRVLPVGRREAPALQQLNPHYLDIVR